jgi:hypothetical protein
VYLSGESHGKESKEKTTWPRQSNILNRSKRESFYFKKGERKEGKSVVRACWVFLSTPANEKLLSIFHHTKERKLFRYSHISKVVVYCCVENEDDERGGRAARTAAVKVEQEYQREKKSEREKGRKRGD